MSGSASSRWRRRAAASTGLDVERRRSGVFLARHTTSRRPFEPTGAAPADANSCSPRAWTTGRTSTPCSGSRARCCPNCAARRPGVRFWIVGCGTEQGGAGSCRSCPACSVTGRVPDTRPWIAACRRVRGTAAHRPRHSEQDAGGDGDGPPGRRNAGSVRGREAQPGRDILLASGVDETVRNIAEVLDGRHSDARRCGAAGGRGGAVNGPVTLRPLDRLFDDIHRNASRSRPTAGTGRHERSPAVIAPATSTGGWRSQRGAAIALVSACSRWACCFMTEWSRRGPTSGSTSTAYNHCFLVIPIVPIWCGTGARPARLRSPSRCRWPRWPAFPSRWRGWWPSARHHGRPPARRDDALSSCCSASCWAGACGGSSRDRCCICTSWCRSAPS